MHRLTAAPIISGLLAFAILAPVPARGQAGEVRLKKALQLLDRLEPAYDSEMRSYGPAIRAIVIRKFRDPASLTASEDDLVTELFRGTELEDPPPAFISRSPEEKLQELKAFIETKAPGIAKKPTFHSGERSTPGGKRIGYVEVQMQGRHRTVVEILAAPPHLTLRKRADTIAAGMRTLHARDPLWWTHMSVGRVRGEYVVQAPRAPRGYIITADQDFAKEWGLSRPKLAAQLIRTIRSTFDPNLVVAIRGDDPDLLRQKAVDLRTQGDAAYGSDPKRAEESYRAAISTDPGYAVAYTRLAGLYRSERRVADARQVLDRALRAPTLPSDARRDLEAQLHSLR